MALAIKIDNEKSPLLLPEVGNPKGSSVKSEQAPYRYPGGWHSVIKGYELYLAVLSILKRQQGIPVRLDDFLKDKGVLSCYAPNRLMFHCKPPDVGRARRSIVSAIGYLRRKGHVIESTREFGQIAYSWHGK